jgi:hypothetical protein
VRWGCTPFHYHHVQSCGVRSSVRGQIPYAPPISTLPKYVLCGGLHQEAESEDPPFVPKVRRVRFFNRFADLSLLNGYFLVMESIKTMILRLWN